MAFWLKQPVQEADLPKMPAKPAVAVALLVLLCMAAPARAATAPAPVLDTTITEGPADGAVTENERPSFSFAATLAALPFEAATFQCSVDDDPAEPCAGPFQADRLEDGTHSFSVFAEDPEHLLADSTPAERSFVIVSAEEECEAFEDEDDFAEEDEEDCEEEADESRFPPEECLLRTARGRLFTYSTQNRVRLVIRYTAFSPAEVIVDYRLAGGRGALRLGSAHQRFAKKGLFRVSERLTDAEMDRVRAARRFTVSMTVPEAPRYCHRYDTRHLTIKRSLHNQLVWFQSDSIFGD
jgi:hypothetical protein